MFYAYGYSFTLNRAKTVKSITLPKNRNVVVLSITLAGSVNAAAKANTGPLKGFNPIQRPISEAVGRNKGYRAAL